MSKRLPILPPERPGDFDADGAPSLWRSINERKQTREVVEAREAEFPAGVGEPSGVSRRSFLKYASLTAAIAGLEGCTRLPKEPIMPYTQRPEDVVPGNPLHYATAMSIDGIAQGLLAVSFEGRPTKLEGNPEHPTSLGATSSFGQAALMQLYDPDRARGIVLDKQPRGWGQFVRAIDERVQKARTEDGGAKVRFLMEPTSSPLQQHLRSRIQQLLPNARFYAWTPVDQDAVRGGTQLAFGRPLDPHYDFTRADVVVALDSDFLECGAESLRWARDFTSRRDPKAGKMNRLYSLESTLTITGGFADNRIRMRSAEVQAFAFALLARIGQSVPEAAPAAQAVAGAQVRQEHQKALQAIANDLLQNRGRIIVIAGERQPAEVHAAAHAINAALGSVGSTVRYSQPVVVDTVTGSESLRSLVEEINAGKVDTLVVTANNPVYGAPVDLDFAAAMKKVDLTIYHALYRDETSEAARWFIPAAHFLESWGDTRGPDGTVSLVQPLLEPLFGGATDIDLLAAFLGEADKGSYAHLREYWASRTNRPDFGHWWDLSLQKGIIEGTQVQRETPTPDYGSLGAALSRARSRSTDGFEINFQQDYKVYDGRFANVGWLQELPHPITKMVWDNAVLVSPATAKKLDVEMGDVVTVTYRDQSVNGPIFVLPGQADDTFTIALGYGRTKGADVATGAGFNAYQLRYSDAPWFDGGASLQKTGKTYKIAQTQEHWSMLDRQPAVMTTVDKLPEAEEHISEMLSAKLPTMQEPVEYNGLKWGMAVDLSRCTGCSACVVACQAENNIPVVGKDLVANTREMHWIRIDRYFAGELDDPQMITQPLMCQHCETAPCEYVCPVNATVHSDEGLNDMAYNRCVGTRYCSNNCPYKVRRFNYFSYTHDLAPTHKMMMNPDVTVRSRGVMEKCTFCVQRIERWRIAQRTGEKGQYYGGDKLQTACQQSCPAEAIVFGDLNDPKARVTEMHGSTRRYDLLYFLGTRPRTVYLARVKNPNPELA